MVTRIIFLTILIAGSIFGYIKYREAKGFETTDDAQLDADISPVTARVSGYIDKVYFTDNQSVKMGDTLVVLDHRDLVIKVKQAEAALENAQAGLGTSRASAYSVSEGANTNTFKIDELNVKLENARHEYERYSAMLNEGSVTQQQYDRVKTEKESLEKQVATASQLQKESNSKTGAANTQIGVSSSIIKQRQVDVDFAKLQLAYSVVLAPFDGIVSKKNALPGQLVQAGQPLCSLVNDQNVWVVANFKETQISKIKEGMNVVVKIDAFPDKKITGKVFSFSSATGSKFSLIPADNASGNYVKVVQRIPVKIILNNEKDELSALKPGMSVYVKVVLNESTDGRPTVPIEKATTEGASR